MDHQPITTIAVHPIHPYLFCSTSRDFTTRIYDLLLEPQQAPNNPPWPPGTVPSLAGAAHGLHMTEPEGEGIGRCVAVLSGGRSGGHLAAVLGAVGCISYAWHSTHLHWHTLTGIPSDPTVVGYVRG